MTTDLINGIPRDQYGMFCAHGRHIMVANPDGPDGFPGLVFADPWPCLDGCTPERVIAKIEDEEEAYEKARLDEYWASQL
jgi:hypothetical protein